MYYHAELNENDICVAVYESLDPIDDPSYIEIDSLDDSYNGRHYDRATGTWEDAGFAQTTAEDGFKAVDYGAIVALLVAAVKELKAAG